MMLDLISEFSFPYAKDSEPTSLGQEESACRFCNRPYSKEEFTNKAHAIPEFLGNKYLFLHDECDECNSYFGRTIERHFDNFIGIKKTFFKCIGKNGVPTTVLDKTDNPKQFIEFNTSFNMLQIPILPDSGLVTLDVENGQSIIRHTKKPYKRTYVYKSLVKMALSIMPADYKSEYIYLLNYVLAGDDVPYPITFDIDENNSIIKILAIPSILVGNEMLFSGKVPFNDNKVFLFKKTQPDLDYLIFSFCIGNYCIQIPLFSHNSIYNIRANIIKHGAFKTKISFPSLKELNLDHSLLGFLSCNEIDLSSLDTIINENDDLFFKDIIIIELDENKLIIENPKKRKISGQLARKL